MIIDEYNKLAWVDGSTPTSASNMNRIEEAIETNRDAVIELNTNLGGFTPEILDVLPSIPALVENAQAIVGIGIATSSQAGIVKPDNTTMTVASNGALSVKDTYVDGRISNVCALPIKKVNGVCGYYDGATFHPFVDAPSFELLGQKTIASTSDTNFDLTTAMTNYKYVIIGLGTITNNDGSAQGTTANSNVFAILNIAKFKTTAKTLYWMNGSQGSASVYNTVITYVSDSRIKLKQSNSASRTYSIYGIK